MNFSTIFAIVVLMIGLGYLLGRGRSVQLAGQIGGVRHLNSLPFYYGALIALWCAIPSLLIFMGWIVFDDIIIRSMVVAELPAQYQQMSAAEQSLLVNSLENIAAGVHFGEPEPALQEAANRLLSLQTASRWSLAGVVISTALAALVIGWTRMSPQYKARVHVETVFKGLLLTSSLIAIFTTVGIVLSVLFEALRFFRAVPFTEFVFGLEWSPQTAIRADQVGSSGAFGAVPLFVGTLVISAIAMLVAVPTGLMSAIYLSEYASRRVRAWVKPALEVLAGIPTVVYGFFAALTVAPFVRNLGEAMGLDVSSESALAAGVVMGVMIIPFVSSLSDDVISAVPQSMRDGSLALGATRSETVKQVIVPAALPGIVGGVLLAVSRAIGETMIVVMAAGLAANLTANPLETVTTVTVQIVTLLVGDQEFNSPKTLAAFALGLMLFVITLCLNFLALHVVKKYREQYE
ncbi:phosphate ABC transporter permease subunit PstC [Proteobacteria bacterium 005FR1]|nr:phosphate ABC transporter permease subunit PstC [Proteobacteria bacterium 005FR1]